MFCFLFSLDCSVFYKKIGILVCSDVRITGEDNEIFDCRHCHNESKVLSFFSSKNLNINLVLEMNLTMVCVAEIDAEFNGHSGA